MGSWAPCTGGKLRHGAGGSPAAFLPLRSSPSPTSAGCVQAAPSQPGAGGGRTLRHGVGQPPAGRGPIGVRPHRAGFPPAMGVVVRVQPPPSPPPRLPIPPSSPQAFGQRFPKDAPPEMRGGSGLEWGEDTPPPPPPHTTPRAGCGGRGERCGRGARRGLRPTASCGQVLFLNEGK